MKTPKQKASEWIERTKRKNTESGANSALQLGAYIGAIILYLDELQRLNPTIKFPEFNKDENE